MKFIKKFAAIFTAVFVLFACSYAAPTKWVPLQPGLEYAILQPKSPFRGGKLYAFRINPKVYKLDLVFAKDHQKPGSSAQELGQLSKAVIAVNGGFFAPGFKPLGLRIKDGVVRNPLKSISWWGVFYVKNNKPYVVAGRQFKPQKNISFAVQAGPRLIINGRIPSLKKGIDERSALCITAKNNIILVSSDSLPLSTTELAELLLKPEKQGGLACRNALNLDGGHSSQLYANIGSLQISVPNFSAISDAIIVVPK